MSSKKLSTVTCHVINAYANTASNVIHAYRAGGERVVGMFDTRWNSAFKQSRSQLATGVAKNATAVHLLLQKYTLKGLTVTSGGAQDVVNRVVKLADAGVMTVAKNVDRFEGKTGVNMLSTVAQAALLGAVPLSNLVDQIERKSATLASKIAGDNVITAVVKRSRPVVRKARPVAKAVVQTAKETVAKVAAAAETAVA
ncbi:MAG: hypothetical protein IPN53_16540 [Comamonadaceae bacterium]|nr:hypothetical protein [Comamonadaceae bacterium]